MTDLGGNEYVLSITSNCTSPVTVRFQAEFLYGPPGVLFDFAPNTQRSYAADGERKDSK